MATENIPSRLHCVAEGNVVAGANEILDDDKGKKQTVINQENDQRLETLETAVGTGGSVDSRIESAKTEIVGGASSDCNTLGKAEALISTNANDIAALQEAYAALTQNDVVVVEPSDTWPVPTPEQNIIYRVVDRTNTPPQYYADYMWNGTAMVEMAQYNNAIDAVPTAGSHNLVESGGVQNELALGAVYDVSAKNPTAGPNSDGKWESISALLSDANINTLIPVAWRKGGMSIKFIQSSDNKYVQYRLMADEWSTTESDWQGVDEKPTPGSDNLVKSGGVRQAIDEQNVFISKLGITPNIKMEQSSIAPDENYYITPKIPVQVPFGMTWNVGEVNSSVYMLAFDNNGNRLNGWRATAASLNIGPYDSGDYAYVICSFKYNAGGSLQVNGKNVWINNIKSSNDYIPTMSDLNPTFNGLLKNYVFGGFVNKNGSPKDANPNYLVAYIANETGTYLNFGGVNVHTGDIIRNYITGGVFTGWVVNAQENSNENDYLSRLGTTIDPNSVIGSTKQATFYIPSTAATYDNLGSVVVPDDGHMYFIRRDINADGSYGYSLLRIPAIMFNSLPYNFLRYAVPSTTPDVSSKFIIYIATQSGTYSNFIDLYGNPLSVDADEVCLFRKTTYQGGYVFVKETIEGIKPTDSQVADAVNDYLDAHPEATTTVQDNSITPAKLNSDYFHIAKPTDGDKANTMIGALSGGAKYVRDSTVGCNLSIGYNNMSNNQGVKNLAIGNQNMINCTGDANAGIGYHSCFRLTTGAENLGVGLESNDDLQTGDDNVAIGGWSLKRNNIGSRNVAVGVYALHGNYGDNTYMDEHDWSDNIAIGYSAGRQILTGASKNILIGNGTTIKNDGENQIVIGHNAAATKDNQVVIGNSSHTEFVLGTKKLIFNNDNTVTWATIS